MIGSISRQNDLVFRPKPSADILRRMLEVPEKPREDFHFGAIVRKDMSVVKPFSFHGPHVFPAGSFQLSKNEREFGADRFPNLSVHDLAQPPDRFVGGATMLIAVLCVNCVPGIERRDHLAGRFLVPLVSAGEKLQHFLQIVQTLGHIRRTRISRGGFRWYRCAVEYTFLIRVQEQRRYA